MATFKAVVLKHQIKSDKTVRIKIKVTQNKIRKFIDTGLVASTADITKSGKIKTQAFIDDCNEKIKAYHEKCNKHSDKVAQMNCDEVVEFITRPDPTMDFIAFADSHIKQMKEAGRIRSAQDYQTAINTLKRYTGREQLPVVDITVKFLQDFNTWIPKNPMPKNRTKKINMSRAPSHYLGSIRTMHNEMKLQYNDEDNGVIPIPGSPFTRFKVPDQPVTEKRAISATAINKIYKLKDKEEKRGSGSCRYNLAKDCFMISFFLMGMNSADMYDCTDLKGNTLRYFRKKTRGRRKDKAEIVITVCPELLPIIKKYRDKTNKRVFDFYQRYRDESTFNAAINKGLKNIIKGLEFYSARHSWATIALNEAGVDKYTVHSALNHVEEAMKMTEVYLVKDWSLINNANRKVIDYVLKPVKSGVKRVKSTPGLADTMLVNP